MRKRKNQSFLCPALVMQFLAEYTSGEKMSQTPDMDSLLVAEDVRLPTEAALESITRHAARELNWQSLCGNQIDTIEYWRRLVLSWRRTWALLKCHLKVARMYLPAT